MTTTFAQVADVVGRAASDPAFRQRLLDAPADTLRGAGIEVPAGLEVRAVENTDQRRHLVLPARPAGLTDADLPRPATTGTASTTAEKLDAFGGLLMATWGDAELRARLLADPPTVLREWGIEVGSAEVRVLEASETLSYLALPAAGSASAGVSIA